MFPGSSADKAASPASRPSSTSADPRAYRAPPAAAISIVDLDELTAIYDRRSGQTHLVASPVPELIAAMGDDWWQVDALLHSLTRDFDLLDADDAALTARLDELVDVGLMEVR